MQKVIPLQGGYTTTGEYSVDLRGGVVSAGLAGDSEIWQLRWTAATTCLVTELSFWAGGLLGFTAGWCSFRLFFARGWSADGTGGATATLTGNNHKTRTSMPTTAIGTVRVATAGALGAGTKTLDAQALTSVGGSVTAAAGEAIIAPQAWLIGGASARGPILLAANEGLSLVGTVPATGTWVFGVSVRCEETGGYRL
jgi:hypothetical protein